MVARKIVRNISRKIFRNIIRFLIYQTFGNQYGEPTTPHKLASGKKPSASNPPVLFFPCVLQKETPLLTESS